MDVVQIEMKTRYFEQVFARKCEKLHVNRQFPGET